MTLDEIPSELKDYICDGFRLIKSSEQFTDREKKDLIISLLSLGAGAGWRPIKITHNALRLFIENDFKKPKGLERAHIIPRRETYNLLLEINWTGNEWWDWYKERDYTVLSTRKENRDEANFDTVPKIDIPIEKMLFRGKRVGFEYGDAEKAFLIKASKSLNLMK